MSGVLAGGITFGFQFQILDPFLSANIICTHLGVTKMQLGKVQMFDKIDFDVKI